MSLCGDEFLRACYYVASEVIRSRRRTGQPIPQWLKEHHQRLDAAVHRMAARGAFVAGIADGAQQSAHDTVIGSREVAAMLDLPARQVRRHAAQMGGVQIAGRWLFDRAAVISYVEGRRR